MLKDKTADLCDFSTDILVCNLPFRGYGKRKRFSGHIRTLRYDQGMGAVRDLLREPGKGKVLVIDGNGTLDHAVFGDIMASLALQHDWEGVIVNGVIRDSGEINQMDVGIKALGTCPQRASLDSPGLVDVIVDFGNVKFVPGARLAADEDGVVLLPDSH